MAYDRSRTSKVVDGFTLSPLPYPVLLILALIFTFLGISWHLSYEEAVETAEQRFGWALFATPVVLIFIVRWISSMENSGWFSGLWSREKRAMRTYEDSSEGSSPWGVAALILLLLILVQYQSNFLQSWFF